MADTVLFLVVGVGRVCQHLSVVILLLNGSVGLRDVDVGYIFTAEFDEVPGCRGVVEVDFGRKVLDAGAVLIL